MGAIYPDLSCFHFLLFRIEELRVGIVGVPCVLSIKCAMRRSNAAWNAVQKSPPECHTQLDKHTAQFKYLRILVTPHFIIGLTVENACPCKEVMPNDRIRSRCIFCPQVQASWESALQLALFVPCLLQISWQCNMSAPIRAWSWSRGNRRMTPTDRSKKADPAIHHSTGTGHHSQSCNQTVISFYSMPTSKT